MCVAEVRKRLDIFTDIIITEYPNAPNKDTLMKNPMLTAKYCLENRQILQKAQVLLGKDVKSLVGYIKRYIAVDYQNAKLTEAEKQQCQKYLLQSLPTVNTRKDFCQTILDCLNSARKRNDKNAVEITLFVVQQYIMILRRKSLATDTLKQTKGLQNNMPQKISTQDKNVTNYTYVKPEEDSGTKQIEEQTSENLLQQLLQME